MGGSRFRNVRGNVAFGRVRKIHRSGAKSCPVEVVHAKAVNEAPDPVSEVVEDEFRARAASQDSDASTCDEFHLSSPKPSTESARPSAAAVLSLSYDCEPTPGVRTAEAAALSEALTQQRPASMYVCGSPGAGKSMTVARTLRDLVAAGCVTSAVWVHCAGLSQPSRLFGEVASQLGLNAGESASDAIGKYATSGAAGEKKEIVVVLEEIDFLPTKLLYTVFEWPTLPGSRLSVIGVSNAIDLPVKSLPWLRATNRMPKLLPFKPYTATELAKIVSFRLDHAGVTTKSMLSPTAITLAGRKVAAVSGDARLVLDVCREAVLSCDASTSLALSPVIAVSQALARRGGSSVVVDTVRALPVHQKLVLCVVACGERRLVSKAAQSQAAMAAKKMTLGSLHESFRTMCRMASIPSIGYTDFVDICSDSLAANHGLLDITEKRRGRKKALGGFGGEPRNRIVRLKAVSVSDIVNAVSDTPVLSLIMGKDG